MLARLLTLPVAMVIVFAAVAQAAPASAEKSVTITPTSGFVGTVVTAKLRGAPPNDPITVIFKGMNDPILATGTTDANGSADFTFTIPYAISGTYPIFFTDFKCSCQIATDFTVTVGVRTPTPVPTATPTRTATPTGRPVVPTATATPTKAVPTPIVPVLGAGGPGAGPGFTPQPGLYGIALLIMAAGFAIMNAGQLRNRRQPARAVSSQPRPLAAAPADLETQPATQPGLMRASGPEGARPPAPGTWLLAGGAVAVATALVWVLTRRR